MELTHIRALLSAEGWRAVYFLEEEPWFTVDRIVGFAAVRATEYVRNRQEATERQEEETDHVTALVAVDTFIDTVENTANFAYLIHVDDIDEEVKEAWREEAREQKKRKKS